MTSGATWDRDPIIERFAISQGVSRIEDSRLLKGDGRFMDDLELTSPAH